MWLLDLGDTIVCLAKGLPITEICNQFRLSGVGQDSQLSCSRDETRRTSQEQRKTLRENTNIEEKEPCASSL